MSSLHTKSICPKQQNIGTVLWATVVAEHGGTQAAAIMADIDRWWVYMEQLVSMYQLMKHFSIAAVLLFPGLCRFPQGHGFKQWMGDDSKALMKECTPCLSNFTSLNQWLGLLTCYCWPCPPIDGTGTECLHGFLLSSPVQFVWRINPQCH